MMRLDNPSIVMAKHPNLVNFIDITYDGDNYAHYMINLEPLDAEDEYTKALKTFIHYLTQQNKYLNKENNKLTKSLNNIWRAVQDLNLQYRD